MNSKKAFTMVETSLALSFIGVLLITVSYIIIQMSSIYQKTLSIKSVNASGRELIDDFDHYIAASNLANTNVLCSNLTDEATVKCKDDGAYKSIYQQYYSDGSNNFTRDSVSDSVPTFGMFCTGRYSYIWNSGYVLNGKDKTIKDYRIEVSYTKDDAEIKNKDFRLLRIKDPLNSLCGNFNGSTYELNADTYALSLDLETEPEELLDRSDTELAIYDLHVFRPGRHNLTGHAFYSGTFILASLQGDVDILADSNYCQAPPEGYISEFTYCAINKFNFAAQAIGESDV